MRQFAAVMFSILGLGACLSSLFPSMAAMEGREVKLVESGESFNCQVFAEQPALKIGKEQNIVVFAKDHDGTAMPHVDGIVDLEYPSGEHQKTYLPPTGEDGLSVVSFSILEKYFDGEIGRVIVRVAVLAQNESCSADTTFLVWY